MYEIFSFSVISRIFEGRSVGKKVFFPEKKSMSHWAIKHERPRIDNHKLG